MTISELITRLKDFDGSIELGDIKTELKLYDYNKQPSCLQCIYLGDFRIYGGNAPCNSSVKRFQATIKAENIGESLISALRTELINKR